MLMMKLMKVLMCIVLIAVVMFVMNALRAMGFKGKRMFWLGRIFNLSMLFIGMDIMFSM